MTHVPPKDPTHTTYNVRGPLPSTCPRDGCEGHVYDYTTPIDPGARGLCGTCGAMVLAERPRSDEARPAPPARPTYRFEAWVVGELPKLCALEPLCSGVVEPVEHSLHPVGVCRKCGTVVRVERRRAPQMVWVPRS